MMKYIEYKINILMSPQKNEFNEICFFWDILGFSESTLTWGNVEFGCSETPEQAFLDAKKAYDDIVNSTMFEV